MSDIAIVVAILAAVAIGLGVGFVARGIVANQSVKAANEKAGRIVAEARAQQKELILQAKDEQVRMQRELDEEGRAKRADLTNLERRLLQRDEQLDQRTDMLEERTRKLLTKEQELEGQREQLAQARLEHLASLEKVSQMSVDEAKSVLLEQVREEAEHDAVRLTRAIERSARESAEEKARDVVVTAIQRVMVDHTAEMTVTVVPIPSDEMKGRIIGREGRNIRALEQATGIDLIIDDTPESVLISGFDPVSYRLGARPMAGRVPRACARRPRGLRGAHGAPRCPRIAGAGPAHAASAGPPAAVEARSARSRTAWPQRPRSRPARRASGNRSPSPRPPAADRPTGSPPRATAAPSRTRSRA